MATGWRVTTGLRGTDPIFVGTVEGAVWIANRGDTATVASFDVHTGTPGAAYELPAPLDGRERIDGGRIAKQVGDRVSVFDVAAGRRLFEASFGRATLVAAHAGQLLLTKAQQDPPELLVVDASTGAVVHTIKLGLGIALRSELFVGGRRAVVFATEAVVGVDLDKGRVVAKRAIPSYVRIEGPFGSHLFVASDAELACFDIEQGKAIWVAPLGRDVIGDALAAVRVDRERVHAIGSLERRDGSAILIATFDRATGARTGFVERAGVRSLPLAALLSPPAGPLAITEGRQAELHVPGRRPIRLALPAGSFKQKLWSAEHLFLLGSELVAIDRTSLTDAPEQPLSLTAVGNIATPSGLVLGVDVLPASRPSWPPIAGDESLLFTAEDRDEPAQDRAPLEPLVASIEAAFSRALPLLRTLAAACDASPRTRDRWERIAPTLGVVEYEPDIEVPGFDELGFTVFASEDDRVLHGVVRSPDGTERGVAVLSVEGDHDFYWSARTFDEWLVQRLVEHSDESRVRLMLDDLGLPPSVLATTPAAAPRWFTDLAGDS